MNFAIDFGQPEDLAGLVNLLYPNYFYETTYRDQDIDLENIRAICEQYLKNICLVARVDDKVVGMCCAVIHKTFYKGKECDVDMFYVLPDYRGTGISRELVNGLVKIADLMDVKIIYSSCLSGLEGKNNELFCNLWAKYGFRPLGTVMIRGGHG